MSKATEVDKSYTTEMFQAVHEAVAKVTTLALDGDESASAEAVALANALSKHSEYSDLLNRLRMMMGINALMLGVLFVRYINVYTASRGELRGIPEDEVYALTFVAILAFMAFVHGLTAAARGGQEHQIGQILSDLTNAETAAVFSNVKATEEQKLLRIKLIAFAQEQMKRRMVSAPINKQKRKRTPSTVAEFTDDDALLFVDEKEEKEKPKSDKSKTR